MERQQLMDLSDWNEEFLHDLINKKDKSRELSVANDQLDIIQAENQNKKDSTKEGFRYSDSMRTCIMDLHGSDISANKISNVINIVSNNLFDSVPSDLPCRSTISNICDEGHVLAKHHVSETLANCQQFDIFSDGTGREGKKIIDLGVHTKSGTLSLGYKSVAREDSDTVAQTIKDSLNEFADLQSISINKLLLQLTAMMSDRSSVMKKTNEIIDEWRKLKLTEDLNENDISKLNFFYCSAHVLLGFHNEITKSLQELAKQNPPIGRDSLPKFSRFKHNSEPSSIRLIRMASEVLGPRGDEKNGARQEWLAYLALKQKSSMIINYRGNRFNNLFTGAVSILNHSEDIIDFISNYREKSK
ncbi:aubergine [Mytilus galloprovincialis]|uniref:Aubergine n=1 Tax=Mytilus galloprovincialis TaxID=29158 RepID=A0A8B6GDW3_MYTGA|nr:aubergine [Mytilus galloprovincialis]